MRVVLNKETVRNDPPLLAVALRLLDEDFEFLRANYPNFDRWFVEKILPGIEQGERTIVIEERDGEVAGVMIVKHTNFEKKLCTLRVRGPFESSGLGMRLFEKAFDILGTAQPLLSVSEPIYPKFSKLFQHFGFERGASYEGLYLPKVRELSYNGLLLDERNHLLVRA
jgi:hypothetical protein